MDVNNKTINNGGLIIKEKILLSLIFTYLLKDAISFFCFVLINMFQKIKCLQINTGLIYSRDYRLVRD